MLNNKRQSRCCRQPCSSLHPSTAHQIRIFDLAYTKLTSSLKGDPKWGVLFDSCGHTPCHEGGLLPRQALEKPNHNKKTTYHDKSPRTNSDKKTASHYMRSWKQQGFWAAGEVVGKGAVLRVFGTFSPPKCRKRGAQPPAQPPSLHLPWHFQPSKVPKTRSTAPPPPDYSMFSALSTLQSAENAEHSPLPITSPAAQKPWFSALSALQSAENAEHSPLPTTSPAAQIRPP